MFACTILGTFMSCKSDDILVKKQQCCKTIIMVAITDILREQRKMPAKFGQAQLVCISPESIIGNTRFWSMLLSPVYQEHLVALVVDEAHCVKTWLLG